MGCTGDKIIKRKKIGCLRDFEGLFNYAFDGDDLEAKYNEIVEDYGSPFYIEVWNDLDFTYEPMEYGEATNGK